MSLAILGLGTALPRYQVTQAEAAAMAVQLCCQTPEQAEVVAVLYRQSGIKTRHMVVPPSLALELMPRPDGAGTPPVEGNGRGWSGPGTEFRMGYYRREAAPLAQQAARAALADSGLSPADVTHLVTVSCTGCQAPGVDIALIGELRLRPTVERVHVGFMGCHGAIDGLRVAQAFCDADPAARVLVCAVELCSLHYHFGWDPKRLVSNALFSDGAAAVVGARDAQPQAVGARDGRPQTGGESDGQSQAMGARDGRSQALGAGDGPSRAEWTVAATGSCVFPNSQETMTWQIGDTGFEMTLAARVPSLIAAHLRPWLERWLAQHKLDLAGVRSWAVHPGGPRILSGVEAALGLTKDATRVSYEVLSECGNMSSATVLFILERLRKRGTPLPCVALGFGPGLTAEAAILR